LEQILRTNPIDSIRTLIDKLSSAEQAIIAQQELQNPTLEAINPDLTTALKRITDYTSLQETYLSQSSEPEKEHINELDRQITQASPQTERE
jgi:hypothetical protein